MAVLVKYPMTRRNRFIVFTVLLSLLVVNTFAMGTQEGKDIPEERKNEITAAFPTMSWKERVDALLEWYSGYPYFQRNQQFVKVADMILENHSETREYILEKFKETKPVPYEQIPSDFAILLVLLEEAGYPNIEKYNFYESMDDYKETVHDLYVMKMDEYLREYKTIDFCYTMLLGYVCFIETGEYQFATLEDLPELLEELTAQGYEDLTINTEHIYSRNKN